MEPFIARGRLLSGLDFLLIFVDFSYSRNLIAVRLASQRTDPVGLYLNLQMRINWHLLNWPVGRHLVFLLHYLEAVLLLKESRCQYLERLITSWQADQVIDVQGWQGR